MTAPTDADVKRARELFKRINGFSDYDLEHGDASVQDDMAHALPHLEQALADARADGRRDGIREAAEVVRMRGAARSGWIDRAYTVQDILALLEADKP